MFTRYKKKKNVHFTTMLCIVVEVRVITFNNISIVTAIGRYCGFYRFDEDFGKCSDVHPMDQK